MDGIRDLGPELADARSFETFQAEARTLLFKDEAASDEGVSDQDPVELRLSIAREDALAFQASVESAIAAELEKSRFPSFAELIAVPWSVVRGIFTGVQEVRYLLGDALTTAQSLARAMTSKGLKGAAEELRKARTDMPGQFATAFERAGGLARQGGQGLKRHYEFVIEAQELRARYAELLAKAPDLSDKGKQFLARLELERHAEEFRETSGNLADAARQGLVVGIAYLIAALQYVQAKVTPQAHKQLAPLPSAAPAPSPPAPAASEPETPLRVLLLPASAYEGGNHGQGTGPSRRRRSRAAAGGKPAATPEVILAEAPPRAGAPLRDLLTGETALLEKEAAAMPAAKEKPRKPAKPRVSYSDGLKKTSFKDLLAETAREGAEGGEPSDAPDSSMRRERRGSLLDRLSSVDPEEQPAPSDREDLPVKGKPKGKRFGLFRPKG